MGNRIMTWLIVIWTGVMALGIFGAFIGIGGDCIGLASTALSECRADAWSRGAVGLGLLVLLWLIVLVPMAIVRNATRGKEGLTDSHA